jgi:hypothetical protein
MTFVFGPYKVQRSSRLVAPDPEDAAPSRAEVVVMMERARKRMDAIREELMRVTWRPDRMRRWCLEHDDQFFDASLPPLNDAHVHGVELVTREQKSQKPRLVGSICCCMRKRSCDVRLLARV